MANKKNKSRDLKVNDEQQLRKVRREQDELIARLNLLEKRRLVLQRQGD